MQLEETSTEQSSCVEAVKVLWKGVNCSVRQCWGEGGRQRNRSQEQPVHTVWHQLSCRRWLLPTDMSISHSLMSGYKLVTPMTSRLTIFYNFIISFLPVFSLAPSTACRNLIPHQGSLEGKLRVLKTVPPENLKNSTFYGHLLESDRTVPQYKGNKHHFVIGIYRQNKDLDFQNKKKLKKFTLII